MAHAPPEGAKPARKLKKVSPIVAPVAAKALQDSLAVQASSAPPTPNPPETKPLA